MKHNKSRIYIGPRTLKTAVAVILSMLIVDHYGASSSKLIFAMLGAMAAVMPTFKESLESCLTQIVGVVFGALSGVFLIAMPIPPLVAAGIGIILVITLYNTLRIHFSPSLPCFIVVLICTTPDIQPIAYSLERIWDTAIGLFVGLLINTLVLPYDNSRLIRKTVESLEHEVILFLEDMFDGDEHIPDAKEMSLQIKKLDSQLIIFSKQKLLMKLRKQQEELQLFMECERKAMLLVAHMEVLCHQDHIGGLNTRNHEELSDCGVDIINQNSNNHHRDHEIVTNYHVAQILHLRQELLDALNTLK